MSNQHSTGPGTWQQYNLHCVDAWQHVGRLSRSSQPVMLLDGQQLGPVCKVLPLHSPRAAAAADHTRPQSPQVSLSAPAVALTHSMAARLVHTHADG